jgi:hypothetical protein
VASLGPRPGDAACAELAERIIAGAQGRDVPFDEDAEDAAAVACEDLSEDEGDADEQSAGFQNFSRRPRSQRRRHALADTPDASSEGDGTEMQTAQ